MTLNYNQYQLHGTTERILLPLLLPPSPSNAMLNLKRNCLQQTCSTFWLWGGAGQVKLHSRATVCLRCEKVSQVQICPKIFVHGCRMDHMIFRVLGKFVFVCFVFVCQICLCLFCDQETNCASPRVFNRVSLIFLFPLLIVLIKGATGGREPRRIGGGRRERIGREAGVLRRNHLSSVKILSKTRTQDVFLLTFSLF